MQFVSAGTEIQEYRGQLRLGIGPHVIYAGDSLQGSLERNGCERLDLGRGQAEARGLDLDRYWRKLWEDIDLLVAERLGAEEEQHGSDTDYQVSEPEACRDDPAHGLSPRWQIGDAPECGAGPCGDQVSTPMPFCTPSSSSPPWVT